MKVISRQKKNHQFCKYQDTDIFQTIFVLVHSKENVIKIDEC